MTNICTVFTINQVFYQTLETKGDMEPGPSWKFEFIRETENRHTVKQSVISKVAGRTGYSEHPEGEQSNFQTKESEELSKVT